ncbi:DUF2807 domain-containing protein [Muricauda sp. JGD-17]|uniref:DUF2807 domain-containing protein n=1 Tax=Flagellimonas ochracea TaxID=2696472 RepID=A0A964TE11_9FLAO|nr:head GIN domain-containing protein [Allomuricauda ochracea]NAY93210.1 DUF2807 domain-containing protein [Allomuricauda ochracea]
MKKIITLGLALSLTVIANAQWGKRIKGNGNVVTIERSVGDYEAIGLAGWFDVELVEGREGEITLKGESNLLEYIKTEVKDGKLHIKKEKGVNLRPSSWGNSILIIVPVEEINSLALSGSGDIVGKTTLKSDDFSVSIAGSGDIDIDVEAEEVSASLSGSGDIALSGKTSNLDVQVSGSGDVKAFELEAEHVDVQISGSADVKVTANQSLNARVSGSGDIVYRGNPTKINTKASGSGDITKG